MLLLLFAVESFPRLRPSSLGIGRIAVVVITYSGINTRRHSFGSDLPSDNRIGLRRSSSPGRGQARVRLATQEWLQGGSLGAPVRGQLAQ